MHHQLLAPKFAEAWLRFPFLAGFDGIVVSGDEHAAEARSGDLPPAPRPLRPEGRTIACSSTIRRANVEGARAVGMHAIHFAEPIDQSRRGSRPWHRRLKPVPLIAGAPPRGQARRPRRSCAPPAIADRRRDEGVSPAAIGRTTTRPSSREACRPRPRRGGRLVAILVARRRSREAGFVLDNVAVAPEAQGRGLRRRLPQALRRCRGRAGAVPCTMVYTTSMSGTSTWTESLG